MNKTITIIIGIFLCIFASAKDNYAVFVYCDKSVTTPVNALRAELTSSLLYSSNDEYTVVNRTDEILSLLKDTYQYQGSGIVRDDQLAEIGQQLGENYICAIGITNYAEYNQFFFECKIINVESAQLIKHSFYPDSSNEDAKISSLDPQTQLKVGRSLAIQLGLSSSVQQVQPKEEILTVGDEYMFNPEYRIGYLDGTGHHGLAFKVNEYKTLDSRGCPTLAQLKLLYKNRATLGLYGEYWSTDGKGNKMFTLNFSDGKVYERREHWFFTPDSVCHEKISIIVF